MQTLAIVGLGLCGVLAACSGGNGGGGTDAPIPSGAPTSPTSSPSPTATAPEEDGGAPPGVDGGSGRSDAQAGVDGATDAPSTFAVNGTLLGSGAPLPYTPVSISGQAPVFTDANGAFAVEGVSAPYDLTVFAASNSFVVYRGLTSPDPKVQVSIGHAHSATLTGFIDYAFNQGKVQAGLAYTTSGFAEEDTGQSAPSFGYSQDVEWAGPSSQASATVSALEWGTNSIGQPGFWFGQTVVTVDDGQSLTNVQIMPSSLKPQAVSGTVTLPSGYKLDGLSVELVPDGTPYGGIFFHYDSSGSTSFTFEAPEGVSTVLVTADANASPDGSDAAYTLALPTSGPSGPVVLAIPLAPQLVLPLGNALGVAPTDVFSWAPSLGLNVVTFVPPLGSDAPTVVVYTADDSCSFPDLSAFGAAFPRHTFYRWFVDSFAATGAHPVDQVVSGQIANDGFPTTGGSAGSFERSFTTAP